MELLASYTYIPFYILAVVTVLCSLLMIFNPNLIRAGFTLIGAFVAIGGIYFTLFANFVAVSQILIYAVGIVLVIIFAIMLCSLRETADDLSDDEFTDMHDIVRRRILAFFVCGFLFAILVYVINSQDWSAIAEITGAKAHQQFIPEISKNYTFQIGNLMLSYFVLPFELISVLLLTVLVGVIILSKKNIETHEVKGEKK